jgi:hypothetical protein
MTLDLTDHEAALLLKELNDLIDGDRYFLSDRIKTLKAIRAKISPAARASSAPEALCFAEGDGGKEAARGALTGRLRHSLCGRVRMKMMANSEPIAVRLQKT